MLRARDMIGGLLGRGSAMGINRDTRSSGFGPFQSKHLLNASCAQFACISALDHAEIKWRVEKRRACKIIKQSK